MSQHRRMTPWRSQQITLTIYTSQEEKFQNTIEDAGHEGHEGSKVAFSTRQGSRLSA